MNRGSAVVVLAICCLALHGEGYATGPTARSESPRGYFGLATDLAETGSGLRVLAVDPDGPAARAGIQVGDLLLRRDGEALRFLDHAQAVQSFSGFSPGEIVTFDVLRAGTTSQVTVIVTTTPVRGLQTASSGQSVTCDGDVAELAPPSARGQTDALPWRVTDHWRTFLRNVKAQPRSEAELWIRWKGDHVVISSSPREVLPHGFGMADVPPPIRAKIEEKGPEGEERMLISSSGPGSRFNIRFSPEL